MSDELYIDGDRYLLAGNIARSDGYVRAYVARPMSRAKCAAVGLEVWYVDAVSFRLRPPQ
jgi:hypothetical protein